MRCPNCERRFQLVCTQEQVDAIESEAEAGESSIREDLLLVMDHLWVEHGMHPEGPPPGFLEGGANI